MELLATLQTIVAVALLVAGAVVMLIGSIGINRLPDFYTRTHAAANVDTLGIFLFVLGLAVHVGIFSLNAAKLLLTVLFLLLTSPVASHALARRALTSGLVPWFGGRRHAGGAESPDAGGKD